MSTIITDLRGSKVTPIHRGSVWQSCGKPSTKFPHGGLVECFSIPTIYFKGCYTFLEIPFFFKNWHFFSEISFFRHSPVGWDPMDLTLALSFIHFYTNIQIFNIFWTRILGLFSSELMQNMVNSIIFPISLPFSAGPSLPGLATVSV